MQINTVLNMTKNRKTFKAYKPKHGYKKAFEHFENMPCEMVKNGSFKALFIEAKKHGKQKEKIA